MWPVLLVVVRGTNQGSFECFVTELRLPVSIAQMVLGAMGVSLYRHTLWSTQGTSWSFILIAQSFLLRF